MLKPFGEFGGDVSEYFSSRTHFAKLKIKKLLRKIKSKNLSAGVFFSYMVCSSLSVMIIQCTSRLYTNVH